MNIKHEEPTASDFMNRKVHTISPDMPLQDVVGFLLKHKISNSPVVELKEGKQQLLGFISERDCLQAISNEVFFGSPRPKQTAQTIMRLHPICVSPDTQLFSLVSIFISHDYRHLPVVEEGELLGIISRRDILKAVEAHYQHELDEDKLKRYRPDTAKLLNLRFLSKNK